MKFFLKICVILLLLFVNNVFAGESLNLFFSKADKFFSTHVSNSQVDYLSIINNSEELNELTKSISEINLSKIQKGNEEKAFLINVYNLLVIKAVLNHYPLKSVMDVGGFFDKEIFNISGQELSLNQIEKDVLFKEYPDPRLHFVLVCAAIGCPQIINSAYFPELLEKQLENRTRITLNDENYIRVDKNSKTVFVSELFKWYEKDFIQNNLTIIQYINQYRDSKIPHKFKIAYISYDWSLNILTKKATGNRIPNVGNLQAYTPSTLLKPGQIEIKLFNNLYSQTAFFDENSKKKEQNSRSTYFTGILNSLYGISEDLNVGLDLYLKSVRNDSESSSPFALFQFSSNKNSRTAVAQIGPKIKISPFKTIRNLAFQSTLLFTLDSDLDGSNSNESPFLDVDGMQWWTQVFYDYSIDNDFLLYFESGLFIRFNSEYEDFFTPFKGFLNYYPSRDWTIYLPIEFTSYWKDASISAHYSQLGLGGKYQLISSIELEILYTKFIFGKNQGAGATYNLGMRIIN